MGEKTSIAWTSTTLPDGTVIPGFTFNPVWGCTAVSPGCDNCYAEAFDHRVGGNHWGKGLPRREFGDKHWNEPLKWNKEAEKLGVKLKVFCGSMCDVMDDEWRDDIRERLWGLINTTPNLIWQLLTKRPQRYNCYLPEKFFHGNVWLGMTAENQHYFDVRWMYLEGAATRRGLNSFVSYEPALGPLSIAGTYEGRVPSWIIFGGESGPGRRPMETAWAENIKRECAELGVKFFMKQMSAHTPTKGAALIPPELLLREFPSEENAIETFHSVTP